MAATEYAAKQIATMQHARMFVSVNFADIRTAILTTTDGTPLPGPVQDIARAQLAAQSSSRDQEFAGFWEVVDRNTDQIVHFFSAANMEDPRSVAEAEQVAAEWQRRAGFNGSYYVRPLMRERDNLSRAGGGFARAPHTSIYQVIDNSDGRVLVGGETRTWTATRELADRAIQQRSLLPADIRIVDLYTNTPYNLDGSPANNSLAGSTQDLQRQRLSAQMPRHEPNDGNWEVYSVASNNSVYRFLANTEDEAVRAFNIWQDAVRNPGLPREGFNLRTAEPGVPSQTTYNPQQQARSAEPAQTEPLFNVRWTDDYGHPHDINTRAPNANAAMDRVRSGLAERGLGVRSIEANPLGQTQGQAQGTGSLPAGNTRWLVLDQNDREVYSFVHRSNQGEANVYAANWLRQNGLLGRGEYMVVPAR
jgi:hypothetical protein